MVDPVLVPLDGSPLAERVLPHVLAVTRGTTPHLDLARVLVPPTLAGDPTPTDPIAWRLARDEATAYLDGVRHALAPNTDAHAGLHDVTAHVLEGDPAGSLLAFARERGSALVALSSHGRSGLAGWNLGGVGHKVADHARSHLLVVRAFDDAPVRDTDGRVRAAHYRRILVPLDGSTRAECALRTACPLAEAHDADLVLAHVLPPAGVCTALPLGADDRAAVDAYARVAHRHAEAYLDARARDACPTHRTVTPHLVEAADLVAALHDVAERERVDLIVAAAHGRTGSRHRPYGSTVAHLLAYGATPLYVVQDLGRDEVEPSAAERAARERPGHE